MIAWLPFSEAAAFGMRTRDPVPTETATAPATPKFPCCKQFSNTLPLPSGCIANPNAPPPCKNDDELNCTGTTSEVKPDSTCNRDSLNPNSKCTLGNATTTVAEFDKDCDFNQVPPCKCALTATGNTHTVQYKECTFDSDACP
jgi:hypothetical protein